MLENPKLNTKPYYFCSSLRKVCDNALNLLVQSKWSWGSGSSLLYFAVQFDGLISGCTGSFGIAETRGIVTVITALTTSLHASAVCSSSPRFWRDCWFIWLFVCLSKKGIKCIYLDLLVAGINTLSPKETQGEKLLLFFFFSIFQLIVHHDGNLGREPESRNQRSKAYPRMLLTGWLYMACLVSFFIQPRTTCPRVIPSTVIWDLSWPSLIKKCPCFPRAETKGKYHRAQLETAINS